MSEAYLRTYVGTLAAFAVTLVASWVYWYGFVLEPHLIVGAVVLAGFILVSDMVPVRVNAQSAIGASDIGLIVAVVALGPNWAAVAVLPSALFLGGRDWLRSFYEVGQCVTIVYLAGIVFSFASEPLLTGEPQSLTTAFYGSLAAGATLLGANVVTGSILVRIKYNQSFHDNWREVWQPYLLSDALKVLTAGAGVLALAAEGPVAAVVVVAGSIGSQFLVYRSREQVKEIGSLRERVGSLEEALSESNMMFGTMMIEELGRKDGYTHRHAAATAVYAQDLAREMKLDEVKVGRLRMAGLLHNIGLFGMPDELLTEAGGRLNSIAQNTLTEHPLRGEEALASVREFEDIASWVRWHHERFDGRGYPDKLRGPWIPLEAKILAVTQAYAAMILDQPRRPGMSFAEAREKLSAGVDTEFDGVAVRAFLRILDTEDEGYRMADDYRFVFSSVEKREERDRSAGS